MYIAYGKNYLLFHSLRDYILILSLCKKYTAKITQILTFQTFEARSIKYFTTIVQEVYTQKVERPKFVDKSPLISYPLRATTFQQH